MIQQIFLEVTNRCTGRCVTCLNRAMNRERGIMPQHLFERLILEAPSIEPELVHLYGVGEPYTVPEHLAMFRFAIDHLASIKTCIITNGSAVTHIPSGVHAFDVSFNAGRPETYREITGLSFDQTYGNLRRLLVNHEFQNAAKPEIHMLVFERNKDELVGFARLFAGWPVALRYAFKYDNQHGLIPDETLAQFRDHTRLPCHYVLNCLNVYWDGRVAICPHDFDGEVVYGDLNQQPFREIINSPLRQQKIREHLTGDFSGICRDCNFNVRFERKYFTIPAQDLTVNCEVWLEGSVLRWSP